VLCGGRGEHRTGRLALRPANWNRDGSVRERDRVLAAAQDASAGLTRSTKDTYVQDDLVVSVARDLAQSAVMAAGPAGMPRTARLTSDAEHLLLTGRPDRAVSLLAQAYHQAR